jgi:hypothetical protein
MNVQETEATLDAWWAEVKKTSAEIRSATNLSLQDVAAYSNRWDAIRDNAFDAKQKIWRVWHDAKTILDDGMRDVMDKGFRRQNDYITGPERKAKFEAMNFVHVTAFRKIDRILTQLEDFLRYLSVKEKWLEAKRINLFQADKKETYLSARETTIVD